MLEIVIDELRQARHDQGLSQEALAEKAGVSQSLVAHVEGGRRPPTPDFLRRCDEALGTGGLLARLRDRLVKGEALAQRFRPWLSIESSARTLRAYEPALVPGLLQTPAYARAVVGDEERAAARMERQAVLATLERFVVVLDEAALTRPVGGPEVMAEQVARLAEEPRAVVHVVPATAGHYVGVEGAFMLATLDDGAEVCLMDTLLGGYLTESPDDIVRARLTWESVRSEALPRRQSAQLLREVSDRWSSRSASRPAPAEMAATASR